MPTEIAPVVLPPGFRRVDLRGDRPLPQRVPVQIGGRRLQLGLTALSCDPDGLRRADPGLALPVPGAGPAMEAPADVAADPAARFSQPAPLLVPAAVVPWLVVRDDRGILASWAVHEGRTRDLLHAADGLLGSILVVRCRLRVAHLLPRSERLSGELVIGIRPAGGLL